MVCIPYRQCAVYTVYGIPHTIIAYAVYGYTICGMIVYGITGYGIYQLWYVSYMVKPHTVIPYMVYSVYGNTVKRYTVWNCLGRKYCPLAQMLRPQHHWPLCSNDGKSISFSTLLIPCILCRRLSYASSSRSSSKASIMTQGVLNKLLLPASSPSQHTQGRHNTVPPFHSDYTELWLTIIKIKWKL